MKPYTDIDSYIVNFDPEVKASLIIIRKLSHKYFVNGVEAIKYGIPTIQVAGKNKFHFAAYTHHVAIYPASDDLVAQYPDLKKHRSGKGTFQFMFNTAIPYDLIEKIIEYRAKN